MCRIISSVAVITRIDTGMIIEEGLIPTGVETLGTIDRTFTFETGVVAGRAKILNLIVASTIEEKSGIILIGSLGTGEVAAIIERTSIIDLQQIGGITPAAGS